jgi:hypothetical protein
MSSTPTTTKQFTARTDAPADSEGLTTTDIVSIVSTVVIAAALCVLASVSARNGWVLWLAVSVGGLGGLVHEIAQSGGKILFFERKLDGVYIGSLAGAVLGAVAGLLAIRGLIINPPAEPQSIQLIYEAFFAGLAMKGVVEAAGGQALPSSSQSVSAPEAMVMEKTIKDIAEGQQPQPTRPDLSGQFPPVPPAMPEGL